MSNDHRRPSVVSQSRRSAALVVVALLASLGLAALSRFGHPRRTGGRS